MPDLSPFHVWFVFAHILGVFLFLLAHGVSVWVLFRLQSERNPVIMRALLDLSNRSMTMLLIGFLVWLIAGILAGFSGDFWTTGRYWIWASLVVALALVVIMTPLGRMYLDRVRIAVGMDKKTGVVDPDFVVDGGAVDAAVASGRPMLLAVIGLGGVAVLSYLMMFKPF